MITITWGRPDKSVLQYDFEGEWDIDDLTEALDAGVQVAARYEHPIDVVVNLAASGFPNLLGMDVGRAFQQTMKRTDEHMARTHKEPGLVVIVTRNGVMRGSLSTMLSLYGDLRSKLAVAGTLEEGLEAIDRFRGRTGGGSGPVFVGNEQAAAVPFH